MSDSGRWCRISLDNLRLVNSAKCLAISVAFLRLLLVFLYFNSRDWKMERLKNLVRSYETWVASNPETVSDLETTTKWVSYFVAGRISDSNIISELVYSLSNILVLYNDRIIEGSRHQLKAATAIENVDDTSRQNNTFCYRLKVMLTTLEYSEVFIEISAKRLFGVKGKWILVALIQLVKVAGRLFILRHSTEQIITSPAMPSLNRHKMLKQQKVDKLENRLLGGEEHQFTFQLKRSGRVVRKIEGAPPLQFREFDLINEMNAVQTKALPKAMIQAEYLYIAKPLIHLATMGLFGEKRWKQYLIALTIDLVSIRLYHKNRKLMTKEQKLEMSRRCINLVLYLMRSPFYENFTQSRLERTIGFLGDNIPFVKTITNPLQDYLCHWQNMYFYLWST